MAEIGELKNLKEQSKSEEGQVENLESEVPTNNVEGDGGDGLPVDVDNNRKAVVELLPPEMWETIFLKLESPKDVLSCWKAPVTWAWPGALRSTKLGFRFQMVFPLVIPYLSKNDLLKCSSLSKSWNVTVDACIQDAEEFGSDSRLTKSQRVVLKLDARNMSDFINRFDLSTNNNSEGKNVPANSVAYRRLDVRMWSDYHGRREMEFNRRNLLKCLEHHGHLIRYFCLDIASEVLDEEANKGGLYQTKFLRKCLKLTPNLRVLHISTHGEYTNLSNIGSALPWPCLKHLKVIKFDREYSDIVWDACAAIGNEFASQLLCLNFGFKLGLGHLPNRFSNLQKIVFSLMVPESGIEFGAFMRRNKPPLKHLSLKICCCMTTKHIDGLSTAINIAGETLQTLLVFHRCWSGKWPVPYITKFDRLRLPELKKLQFQLLGSSVPSADMLRNVCPALQQLTVVLSHGNFTKESKMKSCGNSLDFYGKHLFWNELTDLESVHVEYNHAATYVIVDRRYVAVPERKTYDRYTRGGYEAKVGKANDNDSGASEICHHSTSLKMKKLPGVKRMCRKPANEDGSSGGKRRPWRI